MLKESLRGLRTRFFAEIFRRAAVLPWALKSETLENRLSYMNTAMLLGSF